MAKNIRLTTKNAPLFDHAGLVLRDGQWTEVDLDTLGRDGRFAIETYRGHIVMVHPHDEAIYEELVFANAAARGDKPKSPAPAKPASKKDA